MARFELFTDGACSGNPGPGGWGFILRGEGIDGETVGSVGVLGPTRMNYPAALATVEVVSDRLGRRLAEG